MYMYIYILKINLVTCLEKKKKLIIQISLLSFKETLSVY